MSSRVDLEALDYAHCEVTFEEPECEAELESLWAIARAYPALRDEIKRLRLELASKKQHIRACHAVAHGTAGIAEDALGESLRLAEEARKVGEGS